MPNKNEKYGSSNSTQQYTEAKPKFAPMQGLHYAGNSADGTVSPDPLGVTYDQYNNEIAEDRPMHSSPAGDMGRFGYNVSPQQSMQGAPKWTGRQYSDDWTGGYENYGVTVNSPTTSNSSVTVDVSRADRGKES